MSCKIDTSNYYLKFISAFEKLNSKLNNLNFRNFINQIRQENYVATCLDTIATKLGLGSDSAQLANAF